jgi:hypothetical protein
VLLHKDAGRSVSASNIQEPELLSPIFVEEESDVKSSVIGFHLVHICLALDTLQGPLLA